MVNNFVMRIENNNPLFVAESNRENQVQFFRASVPLCRKRAARCYDTVLITLCLALKNVSLYHVMLRSIYIHYSDVHLRYIMWWTQLIVVTWEFEFLVELV